MRKLESPNSSSFSLYFFNAVSPSRTNASDEASNLKLVMPWYARHMVKKTKERTINGFVITKFEYLYIRSFILPVCTLW